MCIAIYSPPGKQLLREVIRNSWTNNPDGAGYMYIDSEGNIVIKKEMFSSERFYEKYCKDISENPNSPFVVHFRIATHGSIDEKNCHPIRVSENMAIAHNGVIYGVPTSHTLSDTRSFAESILAGLPEGFTSSMPLLKLIQGFIGYSKLIILEKSGKVSIINEEKGLWVDGCWFSNESYLERKRHARKAKKRKKGKTRIDKHVFMSLEEFRNSPKYMLS